MTRLDTGQAGIHAVGGSNVVHQHQKVICLKKPAASPFIRLLAEFREQRTFFDAD